MQLSGGPGSSTIGTGMGRSLEDPTSVREVKRTSSQPLVEFGST